MAITIELGTNQKAERRLLATYVNVNKATPGTEKWELVGAGVEESSIEYNAEVNKVTDIRGITETSVDKIEPQQSFDPHTIRGGSELHAILLDILRRNALTELALFDVLIVEGYLKQTTKIVAEKHSGCTIEVLSKGGSTNVDMPINVHFSNNKTLGTVDAISKNPTFVADNTPSEVKV